MSMKNSNDVIGDPTRGLPACSTVPQTTAQRRAPIYFMYSEKTLRWWDEACVK